MGSVKVKDTTTDENLLMKVSFRELRSVTTNVSPNVTGRNFGLFTKVL